MVNKIKVFVVFISVFYSTACAGKDPLSCEQQIREFYTQYAINVLDEHKCDSLYSIYCTKELKAEIKECYNEGYDVLSIGCSVDLIPKTIQVYKENDYYVASFKAYINLDNDEETVKVIIYLNSNDKIAYIKRPSDGYTLPQL